MKDGAQKMCVDSREIWCIGIVTRSQEEECIEEEGGTRLRTCIHTYKYVLSCPI